MNPKINKLMTLLKPGNKKAMKRAELEKSFNMSDRHIRLLIKEARKQGIIIISSSQTSGYYLPESRQDIEHFVSEGKHRIKEIADTIRPAENYLKALNGQERID